MRTFALTVVLLGLVGLVAARADDDPEPPQPDKGKLLGEWQLTSIKFQGKDIAFPADALKMTMKFERGGVVKMSSMGQDKQGKWQIILNKKPKQIDITDDQKRLSPGIYKIDKDELTICTAQNPGGQRPKDFTSGGVVLVLKRKKK